MEPHVPAHLHALRQDLHHDIDLIDNLPLLQFMKDLKDHWFAQQEEFVLPVIPQPRKRPNRSAIVAAFVHLLPLLPLLPTL
mgnify:CR=1 FL=1